MSAFGHHGSAPFNRPAAVVVRAMLDAADDLGWKVLRSGPGTVELAHGLLLRQDLVTFRVEAVTGASCVVHGHSRPRFGPMLARFPDFGHHRQRVEGILDAVRARLQDQARMTDVLQPPDPRWEN